MLLVSKKSEVIFCCAPLIKFEFYRIFSNNFTFSLEKFGFPIKSN